MFQQASPRRMMMIVTGMLMATMVGCGATCPKEDCMSSNQVPSPATILQQVQNDQSGIEMPAVYLIQSADDVEQLKVAALVAGLNADLTSQDVIIVALGQKPTSGYSVSITGVQSLGDTYFVQGVAAAPKGDMQAQALSTPYAAVKVKRTGAKEVRSEITSAQ
jgi:hypothetical protein